MVFTYYLNVIIALMAKLANAVGLNPTAERLAGSNPAGGTTQPNMRFYDGDVALFRNKNSDEFELAIIKANMFESIVLYPRVTYSNYESEWPGGRSWHNSFVSRRVL